MVPSTFKIILLRLVVVIFSTFDSGFKFAFLLDSAKSQNNGFSQPILTIINETRTLYLSLQAYTLFRHDRLSKNTYILQ